ncbi:MAG: porin [Candidatus Accumulibacter sp. UW20]|jgi:predicted porin
MQKKLIALAVASLASGAAFAQTNVTMYGIADAGYVYSQGDAAVSGTNKFSGVQSGLLSGSRLGFKGEEALGNGLKAIFTLEYSLNIDNNSGIGNTQGGGLNARQQFVGLSGGFGTVALGRQYSPGYMATVNNDPAGGAAFEPQSFMTAQAGNTITPNSGARWDNGLTYTTPNWGGFTGKAIYSFGETSSGANGFNDNFVSTSDNGKWALGANFATGAFNLDALYQVRQNVTNLSGDDINEWYVGGSFDLKFVKLMASYQDQDDKNTFNNDNSTWTLGAVVPLGNFGIHLQYAQTDFDGAWDGNTDGAMLAGTYALSKRTTAYAGYVWVKNDNNSMPIAPASLGASIGAAGESNNTFVAGVRHAF